MSRLIRIASPLGRTRAHAVFVHGLMGHAYNTWRSGKGETAEDASFWPLWLAQDVPGLAVYSLAYEASATGWLGTAMPLQDRATDVLECLLGEEALRQAPVIFICHSLGGLIVKQVVLDLKEQEQRRPVAMALLAQVRQIVFLATPHTGSRQATLMQRLQFLAWPTPVARSLVANDPALRKINVSYRGLANCLSKQLSHKVLYETLATSAGLIVDQASADPGLIGNPVPVHANHIRIAKPENRDADVYRHVKAFVASNGEPKRKGAVTAHALPAIRDRQSLNLLPKLARVTALLLVGFIGYKGVEATITPVPVVERVDITDELKAIFAELERLGKVKQAESAGLSETLILDLARRIKPGENLDLAQAVVEVSNAVDIAMKVVAEGKVSSGRDALVETVLARIAERTQASDISGAAREADQGFVEWEKQEADRRQASMNNGIVLLEAAIQQDYLLRNPFAVAKRVEKIVALKHPDDQKARYADLVKVRDKWYDSGVTKGLNIDLSIALQLASMVDSAASTQRESGLAKNRLGDVYSRIGERETGSTNLRIAIAMYQSALIHQLGLEESPNWAQTKDNLATALTILGERNQDADSMILAVKYYKEALTVRTKFQYPFDWSITQSSLGSALHALGRISKNDVLLTESKNAFESALSVQNRENTASEWAVTQHNFGNLLSTLALKRPGTRELDLAVEAYNSALLVWKPDSQPFKWAFAQYNLGRVLSELGQRQHGISYLEQSLRAYELCLSVWKREIVPLRWGNAKLESAKVLRALGTRTRNTEFLLRAKSSFAEANEIFVIESDALGHSYTAQAIVEINAALAELKTN